MQDLPIFSQLTKIAASINANDFASAAQEFKQFKTDLANYKFAMRNYDMSMLKGWMYELNFAIQIQNADKALNAQSALYELLDDAEISPK